MRRLYRRAIAVKLGGLCGIDNLKVVPVSSPGTDFAVYDANAGWPSKAGRHDDGLIRTQSLTFIACPGHPESNHPSA